VGLVFTQIVKIVVAGNAWDNYNDDFSWIKENTDKGAYFITNSQCLPYYMGRSALYFQQENLKKAAYIWLNQNFNLDRASILQPSDIQVAYEHGYQPVYSNKKTNTTILKKKT